MRSALEQAAAELRDAVRRLRFRAPVAFVYNPLDYAWELHAQYLRRFGAGQKRVLFLGMNPGPFGMAQTGVPFGEVAVVKSWLRLDAPVLKPRHEHPKRPVQGLACSRSEVSGRRLWGLFAARFDEPDAFFAGHFVANYCPLAFLTATGANLTPDKLPCTESALLQAACDRHLQRIVEAMRPDWLIGVGDFATRRATETLAGRPIRIGKILHPSPASPAANRDWPGQATGQLRDLGVWD